VVEMKKELSGVILSIYMLIYRVNISTMCFFKCWHLLSQNSAGWCSIRGL